ncbi:hypothetical protein GOBAR_DD26450 [Gossypium barbadense]|nr:hypothetical protein GOBAR_DD26450 [Gossypium barbadense]
MVLACVVSLATVEGGDHFGYVAVVCGGLVLGLVFVVLCMLQGRGPKLGNQMWVWVCGGMGLKLLWLGTVMKERGKGLEAQLERDLRKGLGQTQNKRKQRKIGNGDAIDESLVRMACIKLSEGSSPFKVVVGDQPRPEL